MPKTKTVKTVSPSSDRVLDAAFQLFVSRGYHGTSMREIAEASGLAAASIYNHFDSKEAIFWQVLEVHHPYHEMLPILASAQGDDAEALIRNIAERAYAVVRTRKELLHLLFIEVVEFEGRHLQDIFRKAAPQVFAFITNLQAKDNQMRQIPMPSLFISLVGLIMSHWLIEAMFVKNIGLPGIQDHFDTGLDIYLHGILATPK